jgi:hypothetical protein
MGIVMGRMREMKVLRTFNNCWCEQLTAELVVVPVTEAERIGIGHVDAGNGITLVCQVDNLKKCSYVLVPHFL